MRFQRNNILIVDLDQEFAKMLAGALNSLGANCSVVASLSSALKAMQKIDFEMVVSNYHLSDGIIHQLIDWSTHHLPNRPVFTCVGYPFPADLDLISRTTIADFFSKSDQRRIIDTLSLLLFDFTKFRDGLLEISSADQIHFEITLENKPHAVRMVELFEDSLKISLGRSTHEGLHGTLNVKLNLPDRCEEFAIPGYFLASSPGSSIFKVQRDYQANWSFFYQHLEKKDVSLRI